MQRIIIPTHYVPYPQHAAVDKAETAPASIWRRHLTLAPARGVYPRLSVMQGRSAISAMPMRAAPSRLKP